MKLLNKEILQEYGFIVNIDKTTSELEVLTREKIDIVIKGGDFYYSNMGFDYPIRDLAALRRLYKEVRRRDLNPA